MLTGEGPWRSGSRRKISRMHDEDDEKDEPVNLTAFLDQVAARIEADDRKIGEKKPALLPTSTNGIQDTPWLVEVPDVHQRPGEGFRRSFVSRPFRLWVWYLEDRKSLTGFQLLWGGVDDEKAITWTADNTKMMQVLSGDAGTIRPSTIYVFQRYAEKIDQELIGFVVEKIMDKARITKGMMDAVEREYRERRSRRS